MTTENLKAIDEGLLRIEQEKRLKLATASFLIFGNTASVNSFRAKPVLNYNEAIGAGQNYSTQVDAISKMRSLDAMDTEKFEKSSVLEKSNKVVFSTSKGVTEPNREGS